MNGLASGSGSYTGYCHPAYANNPWPSHVTHSWTGGYGMGVDPMASLASAIDRLAAALEEYNKAQLSKASPQE